MADAPADPPPDPGPAAPVPVEPDPKRPARNRVVLVVALSVALACCGGGATLGLVGYAQDRRGDRPVREAADGFLGALERGDHAGAYDRLCDRTRDQFSRDAFESGVRAQPALRSHRITAVSRRSVDARPAAFVDVELTHVNGAVERHSMQLSGTGDTWQVCGSPY